MSRYRHIIASLWTHHKLGYARFTDYFESVRPAPAGKGSCQRGLQLFRLIVSRWTARVGVVQRAKSWSRREWQRRKGLVKQQLTSLVSAKIVALRPSTITNCAWIYAASPVQRLAEWEENSAGKWCVFRHNDAIDEAWLTVRRAVEAGRLRSQRFPRA